MTRKRRWKKLFRHWLIFVRKGKALYVGLSKYPLDAYLFASRYLKERDVPCLLYRDGIACWYANRNLRGY